MRTCIKCGRESIMAICEMCSIDGKFDKESDTNSKTEKSSNLSNKNMYSSFLSFMMDKYGTVKNKYVKEKTINLYKNPSNNYSDILTKGYAPAYANSPGKSNYSSKGSYSSK